MRKSGVLMHITSLPSRGGVGTLGKAAYEFVDFVKDSGMNIWQMLPVGPTGYAESPYQSASTYAGNPLMIDFDLMAEDGLLPEDVYVPLPIEEKVDFEAVKEKAGWISPVPGGVGKMTIAMLMENTVSAAEKASL